MPINRGDVYFVDLSPTLGREQAGSRPVVVVSNDGLNRKPLVVVVVPGTSGAHQAKDHPSNVRVPVGEANLPDETLFLTFQVRGLDHSRFRKPPVGTLSPEQMEKIEKALAWTLAMAGGFQRKP
jgi:mRNA interferase MazF